MSVAVLYVVAVPIGHFGDMSPRALDVLSAVGVVAAEDTRTTGKLLQHYGLQCALIALHDHNEAQRVPALIARLQAGESIALVSDAGTPLISDPGYRLIAAAHDAGITVSPIPGACAAVAALSAAGIATDRFFFEGFLPAKSAARQARLRELVDVSATLVFYEAPHRILETLADLVVVFGADRRATLARELTKTFETIRRDQLQALYAWVMADGNQQRGEIVLVVAGAPERKVGDQRLLSAEEILKVLVSELPLRQAAASAAKLLGLKPNALYDLAREIKAVSEINETLLE
jgi:16S rRNA (cytidine1402-2'-O)-methyltransferase